MINSFYLVRRVDCGNKAHTIIFWVSKGEDRSWIAKSDDYPGLVIWDKSLDVVISEIDPVTKLWFEAKYKQKTYVSDLNPTQLIVEIKRS